MTLPPNTALNSTGLSIRFYDTDKLDIDDIISGEIIPHACKMRKCAAFLNKDRVYADLAPGGSKSFTALAMAGYNSQTRESQAHLYSRSFLSA